MINCTVIYNIRTYENGEYTIFVRSYYTDGDTADSEPIILIVNNPVYLWGQDYLIENTEFLDLSSRGLTGTIPPEIGNLVNLKYLWLNDIVCVGVGRQIEGGVAYRMYHIT